jgi:phospholipid transport system substrate-binding protein
MKAVAISPVISMVIALSAVIALSFAPVPALCQQDATATVQAHVDSVLKVLGNPALKGPKGEERKRVEVKAEADKLFDFVELSKRTLGLSWNRFSIDQRKEFVALYKQLLEETYMDRLMTYAGEKMTFSRPMPLDSNTVEVKSELHVKTGPVALVFRLINEGGQWKVYDVVIEGVSLITNYRSQFREILANRDPAALLDTLRKTVGKGPK